MALKLLIANPGPNLEAIRISRRNYYNNNNSNLTFSIYNRPNNNFVGKVFCPLLARATSRGFFWITYRYRVPI